MLRLLESMAKGRARFSIAFYESHDESNCLSFFGAIVAIVLAARSSGVGVADQLTLYFRRRKNDAIAQSKCFCKYITAVGPCRLD
jgi:hypothetical protein